MNSFISVEEGGDECILDEILFSASSISGSSIHSGHSVGSIGPHEKRPTSRRQNLYEEVDWKFASNSLNKNNLGITPCFVDQWLSMSNTISDTAIEELLLSQQNSQWMLTSDSESEFDGFSVSSGSSFEGFQDCGSKGDNKVIGDRFSKTKPAGNVNTRSSNRPRKLSRRSLDSAEEELTLRLFDKKFQNCSKGSIHTVCVPNVQVISEETKKQSENEGKQQQKEGVRRTLRRRTRAESLILSDEDIVKEVKIESNEKDEDPADESPFEGFEIVSIKSPLLQNTKSKVEHEDMAEFIGKFCNSIGCTISWLESDSCMEYPVSVTNGIVFELNEFAKKIAWESHYVARWILRLRGYNTIDTSGDDLKKIHLLLKRRKALSVTFAGRVCLKQKLNSFDSGEFSLPSAEKLDNQCDKSETTESKENELIQNNLDKNENAESIVSMRKSIVDKECLDKSPLAIAVSEKLSELQNEVMSLHSSNTSSSVLDKNEILSEVNETMEVDGNDAVVTNSIVKENIIPKFCDLNELIGNHCKACGITPGFLNSFDVLPKNKIITNGIVYELYNFYRKKGATLTSLVHTLYSLKSLSFTKVSVISTMAKIHELVKVMWRQMLIENPDMPYEQFVLPSLKSFTNPESSEEAEDYDLLPYDEQKANVKGTGSVKDSSGTSLNISVPEPTKSKDILPENIENISGSSKLIDSNTETKSNREQEDERLNSSAEVETNSSISSDAPSTAMLCNDNSVNELNESGIQPGSPCPSIQNNDINVSTGTSSLPECPSSNEIEKNSPTKVENEKLGSDRKMKSNNDNSNNSSFDLSKTKGKIGQITKGDIVFLYTRWLKQKIQGKKSIFVSDLSKDLDSLMEERQVISIRIPVGTLMSSSVKLFEEFREISKIDGTKANKYLLEDWLSDVQTSCKSKMLRKSKLTSNESVESSLQSNKSATESLGNEVSTEDLIVKKVKEKNVKQNASVICPESDQKNVFQEAKKEVCSNKSINNQTTNSEKNNDSTNLEQKILKNGTNIVEQNNGVHKLSEVDKIVGYRVVKVVDTSVTEYRVRWLGSSSDCDSWVEEKDLQCPEILYKFWNALHKQRVMKGLMEDSIGCNGKIKKFIECQLKVLPFIDESKTSINFFCHFISKLKNDLINYKLESDEDTNFVKRIKVTKGDVLKIYDNWRSNNVKEAKLKSNFRLNLNTLKEEVKNLMEQKKVRNFNSSCLMDCCYRMSLMRSKCKDKDAIEEYINGDFIELMKSSQKHLDVITKENQEKCANYKKENTTNIEKGKENAASEDLVSKLNCLEKEMLAMTKVIKNKNSCGPPNHVYSMNDKKMEKAFAFDIDALKRQNENVIDQLQGYGLSSQALEEIINIAL